MGPSHQCPLRSLSTLHSAFSLTKSTPAAKPHANPIIPAPLITLPHPNSRPRPVPTHLTSDLRVLEGHPPNQRPLQPRSLALTASLPFHGTVPTPDTARHPHILPHSTSDQGPRAFPQGALSPWEGGRPSPSDPRLLVQRWPLGG